MPIYPERACLLGGLGDGVLKIVSYGATPEQWFDWLRMPVEHAARDNLDDLVNALVEAGADGSSVVRGGSRGRYCSFFASRVMATICQRNADLVQPPAMLPSPSPLAHGGGSGSGSGSGSCSGSRRGRRSGVHVYPKRASLLLDGLGGDMFKVVSCGTAPEQWAEWLRVPLEHAAARGNLHLVNALLGAGADGSAGYRGCRGRTLLDAAAVGGSVEVVAALLQAGAQPDVNVVSLSPRRSALYAATVCGHEAVARRLILAGADIRFEDFLDQCSVLHEAAYGGHERLVEELLEAGADPNSLEGRYGSTAVHQAADGGHTAVVHVLLQRGANKDALCPLGSPLVWAARHDQYAVVETLLAAGADVSLRSPTNRMSALDNSACYGHIAILKALLGHGADVDSRDSMGLGALHKAGHQDQAESIHALIEAGAGIELKTNDGGTPLSDAAYFSKRRAMLALLERGAGVNVRSTYGATPLHAACFGKFPGLERSVDLLLRWGADETARDEEGRTPSDYLGLANDPRPRPRCSQEGRERAGLLLVRAPADRAWRRRNWLVMLRSRASRARKASYGNGNGGCDGGSTVVGGEGPGCKAVRTEDSDPFGLGARRQVFGGISGGSEGGVSGQSERGDLGGVVELLIELELEGVFRTVVGLL